MKWTLILADQDIKQEIMNWGTGVTIAILAFMAFILSMVVQTFTRDADLIQDDYYVNEANYDSDKAATKNYSSGEQNVIFQKTNKGVLLMSPGTEIQDGKILFYRADKKIWDREYSVNLDDNFSQVFPITDFHFGYYDIRLSWEDDGIAYLFEDEILM